MDTKELLKKVRKIEIKTRRLSDHIWEPYLGPWNDVEGANISMEMTFVLLTGITARYNEKPCHV
jgi:hypothetical protein